MQLPRDEVHCWYVDLDVPTAGLSATLADDERTRSARLCFDRDRRRFVVAHGVLRALLGRYLGTDPGGLRFVRNAFGKPELGPGFPRFNLSHSAGLAVIAVARAEVGVDVERVQPQPEYAEIARCHFSASEVERLEGLPGHLRAEAFLRGWTRKEAYAKARGEGLANFPPFDPHGEWSLHSLEPGPGYVGALAIAGDGWRLAERQWPPTEFAW